MTVPASVMRTVRSLFGAAERVAPEHRAELLAITQRLQARLAREMRALAPGSYTSVATASKRLQLQALAERLGVDYGTDFAAALERQGIVLAGMARGSLVKQVAEWEHHFRGVADRFVAPDLASDLLSPGLLEHYAVSRRVYGMAAIRTMRQEMASGALLGEPLSTTWERVAAKLALEPHRAERIVRTEHSFAIHQRQLDDMRESFGASGRGWWKSLVATIDSRTGEDSIFVNGQIRRLNEAFEDNEGRVYMTPPNRPNDREVMIFIPSDALTAAQKRNRKS